MDKDQALGGLNLKSYIIGFILSIALTLIAYFLVINHFMTGLGLMASLGVLAIAQFFVQLFFFLHLGKESKPRWNFVAFLFAFMVVGILVFGTLWIMNNLEYNHDHGRSPDETEKYIIEDEGISR